MKIKIYATKFADKDQIIDALNKTRAYFPSLDIQFSDITYLKNRDDDPRIYETKWGQTLLTLSLIKVISDKFLLSLDAVGYDGLLLFLDKEMALETIRVYAQETPLLGIPYGAVYLSQQYVKIAKGKDKYGEEYTNDPVGSMGDANSHAVIHEIMHAICIKYGIWDFLHELISEGQFDSFRPYLLSVTKLQAMKESNSQLFLRYVLSRLNTDVTPKDEVPDNVACAASVSTLLNEFFKAVLKGVFAILNGTYVLTEAMKKDARFKQVFVPEEGSIVAYPTGTGNGKLSNGHVFICGAFQGDDTKLYSNDSATGLFKQNYTLKTARARYVTLGGFSEIFFTLV